jgi:hypothetical protein
VICSLSNRWFSETKSQYIFQRSFSKKDFVVGNNEIGFNFFRLFSQKREKSKQFWRRGNVDTLKKMRNLKLHKPFFHTKYPRKKPKNNLLFILDVPKLLIKRFIQPQLKSPGFKKLFSVNQKTL